MNQPKLSFAHQDGRVLDLWPTPSNSVSYTEGNSIGRDRAAELVEHMRENQAPMMLGHVVQAIVARGVVGAIEIGFFHGIAVATMEQSEAEAEKKAERPRGTLGLKLCGGTDTLGSGR